MDHAINGINTKYMYRVYQLKYGIMLFLYHKQVNVCQVYMQNGVHK